MRFRRPQSPSDQFFGSVVELDCHMQDLRLLLRQSEAMEFPTHEDLPDDEALGLIGDIHPDLTRKGFVVMLLIALEDHFKTFCRILKRATANELAWTDLKGTALERYIAYAEKVCDVKPVCDPKQRQLLVGLIEVRNCIIHNNSAIEGFGKTAPVVRFASSVDGVGISDGEVQFEYDGCLQCANIVERFLEQGYRAALDKFPREG